MKTKEIREQIIFEIYENLVKIADPQLGWVRMGQVAQLLLVHDNNLENFLKAWAKLKEKNKK